MSQRGAFVEPLKRGDRVAVETGHGFKFYARFVRFEEKIAVLDRGGETVRINRCLIHYRPHHKTLKRRIARVRKSREDERLRRKLGLPTYSQNAEERRAQKA